MKEILTNKFKYYFCVFLLKISSAPATATSTIPAIAKIAVPAAPVCGRSKPLLLTTVTSTFAVLLPVFRLSGVIVVSVELLFTYAFAAPVVLSVCSILITTGSFRSTYPLFVFVSVSLYVPGARPLMLILPWSLVVIVFELSPGI